MDDPSSKVDQVDDGSADATDGGKTQFAEASGDIHRLCTLLDREPGGRRVLHAEAHGAAEGPLRIEGRRGAGLVVQDDVDLAWRQRWASLDRCVAMCVNPRLRKTGSRIPFRER